METFLNMSLKDRKRYLHTASLSSGIPAEQLEHDWWQSFVLKNIFSLSISESITLKGSRALYTT